MRRTSTRGIQSLANFGGEFFERERLADQIDSSVQASVMDDRGAGVSGHIKNAEIWSPADDLVGKLATVKAAWHHDVSEQKIDVAASA